MYKLTNSSSILRNTDGANIPADLGNTDYAEYLLWLGAGNTPEPVDVPTQVEISASVINDARSLRAKLFTVVDGLQCSALALGNSADAMSIENFKAGLRDITKIDLSSASTVADMRALVLKQYKSLAGSAPSLVQLAFARAVA